MNLQEKYNRDDFIKFLKSFIPAYAKDVRPADIGGLKVTKNAYYLGECPELDLSIFELTHSSSRDARVALANDGFKLMKNSSSFRALVVYQAEKSDDWRLSLMTANLDVDKEGAVTQTFSNPRRFSFFLGPNAKIHTPEQYLQGQVKDFEDLKRRFSIETVNKDFYEEIAALFTRLAGGKRKIGKKIIDAGRGYLDLPGTVDDTLDKQFTVRLIGRLVFCWFLKKKCSDKKISLLPEEIYSVKAVSENKGYYHSILEPLFFEVLNTPAGDRENKYQELPWSQIPFLNGGLFNPHQYDFYEPGVMGISKHINTLNIPDIWIKELFKVFETYNFTIDENTPVDVELSIDPEMLGRIFENLLADINPETGETARKATGSYYTPRPIVEYMVDESLKQYLLTKTGMPEQKIGDLLVYDDQDSNLSETQKQSVIEALDTIKIIDPACGSGAFPMGILQKMLLILRKVDPDSQNWLDKKLATIKDPSLRRDLKTKLKGENFNYIHKLGIVRDAIYGVDIQPIAVEIAKLRFFLSLIVDELVDDAKENRGIEPLPNLEFKFVCANSLIGLPERGAGQEDQHTMFEADEDIKILKELRDGYLRSYGNQKKSIEKKFLKVQSKMAKHALSWALWGGEKSQTMKLSQWNPFSEEVCGWFDAEWMFGIGGGFDVVIANPPYGADIEKGIREELMKQAKYTKNSNSAAIFIDFGINRFLSSAGTLTYIVPKSLLYSEKWFSLVRAMLGKVNILVDVEKAFENVKLEQAVFVYGKNVNNVSYKARKFLNEDFIRTVDIENKLVLQLEAWICDVSNSEMKIIKQIDRKKFVWMKDVSETRRGVPLQKYLKGKGDFTVIGGKNIFRYGLSGNMGYLSRRDLSNNRKKLEFLNQPKIISQNIIAHIQNPCPHIKIMATYDKKGELLNFDTVNNSVITDANYDPRYILALMNSTFISWYAYRFIYCSAIRTMHFDNYYIGKIPVPVISKVQQESFAGIVDQIIGINQREDYGSGENKDDNKKVKELEIKIDEMVLNLYGLMPEEKEIVRKFKK